GDGTFRAGVQFAVGTGPVSLAIGDFDGEGRLDIVTANKGSKDVSILLGNGDGTFRAAGTVPVATASGSGPVAVVVGQFSDDNGDGVVDSRDFLDVAVLGTALDRAGVFAGLVGA